MARPAGTGQASQVMANQNFCQAYLYPAGFITGFIVALSVDPFALHGHGLGCSLIAHSRNGLDSSMPGSETRPELAGS